MSTPLDRLKLEEELCQEVMDAMAAHDRARLYVAVERLNRLILDNRFPSTADKRQGKAAAG